MPDEPVSLGSNTGSVGEAISGLWEAIVEIGRVVGYAGAWSDYASGSLDSLNNIVFPRLSEARALQDAGFHGAAVVSAYTAIELTLETVVVRPFVLAGFMTEDLARVFADRILRAPVVEHRKMVSGLARVIGVDLGSLQLADGTALWDYLTGSLPELRNRIVHAGATATAVEGARAVDAAAQFVSDFAQPLFAEQTSEAAEGSRETSLGTRAAEHPLAKLMGSVSGTGQERKKAGGAPPKAP